MSSINNLKLHYIFPGYNGLGGPIRLLLEDAQVPYEWIHIDVAQTWPKTKQSWIDSGYPFDCAPMIKLEDGKQYSGAQPILRFLSKSLGKYIPTNDIDLETFVETVSDYSCDWFKAYGMAARNRDQKDIVDKYIQEQLPMYLQRFERIYGVKQGPYAAGDEITYCDFIVFVLASRSPSTTQLKDYPNLSKFVETMSARPGLENAVESEDYAHTGIPL
ncbi:predicted protein [Lichtheimia corymbifera JMRC:FSU:9682]|uniref:Glutathione s-transferase n=1 Tax=Lichtheimia corymbifera JMRC:FSU:9682 TaxID=1263082 RepID=A0A068RIZ9_9FUNG|nr:predicted protein [Lichtheimia corymbifera JMRC:FSU:9682]